MSKQLTIEQRGEKFEQQEVDIKFTEIVSNIEEAANFLTDAEKDDLSTTPQMKPAGNTDQGYRHD